MILVRLELYIAYRLIGVQFVLKMLLYKSVDHANLAQKIHSINPTQILVNHAGPTLSSTRNKTNVFVMLDSFITCKLRNANLVVILKYTIKSLTNVYNAQKNK